MPVSTAAQFLVPRKMSVDLWVVDFVGCGLLTILHFIGDAGFEIQNLWA